MRTIVAGNSNNYKTSFCSVVEVYKGVSADDFQGNIYAREGSPTDNWLAALVPQENFIKFIEL